MLSDVCIFWKVSSQDLLHNRHIHIVVSTEIRVEEGALFQEE